MTETSFPQRNMGVLEAEWETIHLPMGRGVIDRGGFPYRLTDRDSVTDMVTIAVDTRHGKNEAILDGFVHRIDTSKQISIPPVATDTVYEIGLVYDPTKHQTSGGPIELTAWTVPADMSNGKSRLVLHRGTRKPNLALGSTPFTEERPRVCPVIEVSREDQLPVRGLVLVGTIGVARVTNSMFRADILEDGSIKWTPLGASELLSSGDIDAKINEALGSGWKQATPYETGDSIVRRWPDGIIRVGSSTKNPLDALNLGTADGRYSRSGHTHSGSDITSRIPFDHVDGSHAAWQNSNLGSQWTSLAVNSQGFLGRYPSALKYKKNIRAWNPDPRKILELEPVQYDVRADTAGASESSDKGLIGFVADSYVETLRELVMVADGEVEGFHYHLVGVAQQVVLRYLDKRVREQQDELDTLKFNQAEILSYLGLGTDADGRVIIEGEIVPDNGSEA